MDDIEAHFVGAMWVGKITGSKNLVWLYLIEQFQGGHDILFVIEVFGILGLIIERQVLEVDVLVGQTGITGTGNGFTFADKPFYREQLLGIRLVGLFTSDKLTGVLVNDIQGFCIEALGFGKIGRKLDEPEGIIVPYCGVA